MYKTPNKMYVCIGICGPKGYGFSAVLVITLNFLQFKQEILKYETFSQ